MKLPAVTGALYPSTIILSVAVFASSPLTNPNVSDPFFLTMRSTVARPVSLGRVSYLLGTSKGKPGACSTLSLDVASNAMATPMSNRSTF